MNNSYKKLLKKPQCSKSTYKKTRHNKKFDWKVSEQPCREGMKKRHKIIGEYGYNHHSIYVLERWLISKVGEKWDNIYSQVSNISKKSTYGYKILRHVKYLVATKLSVDNNGKLFYIDQRKYFSGVLYIKPGDLYVNSFGILCMQEGKTSKQLYRQNKKNNSNNYMDKEFINGDFLFEKIKGVWFYFYLDSQFFYTENLVTKNQDGTSLTKQIIRKWYRTGNEFYYKGKEVSPINKRQANKQVLRNFKLKNDM